MAFTAAPVPGEFWMDNDRRHFDEVTKKLRSAQDALAVWHTRFMKQFKWKFPFSRMPDHLYDIIVQWCIPSASDIRIAIKPVQAVWLGPPSIPFDDDDDDFGSDYEQWSDPLF